jgi:hypothetical protein
VGVQSRVDQSYFFIKLIEVMMLIVALHSVPLGHLADGAYVHGVSAVGSWGHSRYFRDRVLEKERLGRYSFLDEVSIFQLWVVMTAVDLVRVERRCLDDDLSGPAWSLGNVIGVVINHTNYYKIK